MIPFKSAVAKTVPFDNSSNGFTSIDVQSAIEEAKSSGIYYSAAATSTISTTSGTFSVVGSMTLTPVAGTYLCIFSADVETGNVNGQGEFQFFNGGVAISGTKRQVELEVALLWGSIGTARLNVGAGCFFAVVTANGTNAIDVRYRSVDGRTVTVTSRSMFMLKVA